LDEVIQELTNAATAAAGQGEEGWAYASAVATEVSHKNRELGSKRDESGRKHKAEAEAEVVVMPSGALASVSFTKQPGRVSLERINELYPKLIETLVKNKSIGFLLVKSASDGSLAIGKEGINYLDKGKIQGRDPLAAFGPNAAAHVKRTAAFPHCPDIVINSTYWPETGEVAAFEELVGSHGAMGGSQQYPFILYPSELKKPAKEIVGAENVHKQFRNWLANLGWDAYKT